MRVDAFRHRSLTKWTKSPVDSSLSSRSSLLPPTVRVMESLESGGRFIKPNEYHSFPACGASRGCLYFRWKKKTLWDGNSSLSSHQSLMVRNIVISTWGGFFRDQHQVLEYFQYKYVTTVTGWVDVIFQYSHQGPSPKKTCIKAWAAYRCGNILMLNYHQNLFIGCTEISN